MTECSEVFVIRTWLERAPVGAGSKRGYVEHVRSGRRRYFSELVEALDFIAVLSSMPLDSASGRLAAQPQKPRVDEVDPEPELTVRADSTSGT